MASFSVTEFIEKNYKHFNARALKESAKAYVKHIDDGGKMVISMCGALSTAEIGISLAKMIRQKCVHFISCNGANLEEDIFHLVAHSHYDIIPNWREFTVEDDVKLLNQHKNRVTDTIIPEEEAMRVIESHMLELWKEDSKNHIRRFPHEYFYKLLLDDTLKPYYDMDIEDSWVLAAARWNLPMSVPGWEDSTMGDMFAAAVIRGEIDPTILKTGIEYTIFCKEFYEKYNQGVGIGFFQIGGGAAGDHFSTIPPMMIQDLQMKDVQPLTYFCQITNGITSFGSFSQCQPIEKISWQKVDPKASIHWIESDATIVAPLIFEYVLENYK
jgi:deoxyhypusine synthase